MYQDANIAQQAAQALHQGRISFADVAKQVSIGPNPEQGGELGYMRATEISPDLFQLASSLKAGQVSQLFGLGDGIVGQIRLVGVRNTPITPVFNDETQNKIKEILQTPKQNAAYQTYLEQLNKKAIINIRY